MEYFDPFFIFLKMFGCKLKYFPKYSIVCNWSFNVLFRNLQWNVVNCSHLWGYFSVERFSHLQNVLVHSDCPFWGWGSSANFHPSPSINNWLGHVPFWAQTWGAYCAQICLWLHSFRMCCLYGCAEQFSLSFEALCNIQTRTTSESP